MQLVNLPLGPCRRVAQEHRKEGRSHHEKLPKPTSRHGAIGMWRKGIIQLSAGMN